MRLVTFVFAILALNACGDTESATEEETTETHPADVLIESPTFAQFNVVATKYCSGSSCHSQGSSETVYIDNQAMVDASAVVIKTQIESGAMPVGITMSAEAKATALNYIANLQ